MNSYTIIEIAAVGVEAYPWPASLNIRPPTRVDHYWRIRWIEDGEEIDCDCDINDLATIARQARSAGEPVAWRYYVTGVE